MINWHQLASVWDGFMIVSVDDCVSFTTYRHSVSIHHPIIRYCRSLNHTQFYHKINITNIAIDERHNLLSICGAYLYCVYTVFCDRSYKYNVCQTHKASQPATHMHNENDFPVCLRCCYTLLHSIFQTVCGFHSCAPQMFGARVCVIWCAYKSAVVAQKKMRSAIQIELNWHTEQEQSGQAGRNEMNDRRYCSRTIIGPICIDIWVEKCTASSFNDDY